ncbi:MAG: acylneuraminate cytidylyltransferase family protein [Candidatus Colwellbacteria bacterium]|nr:acylneuraminate cytidylyltransferase family protein [Candidatus Colwellbacteria bacterium]
MSSTSKSKKKILALIPARGGSKGIPGKNIVDVGGLPLIAYSIKTARQAKLVNKVVVATDGEEITRVALKYKASVIQLPKKLTGDRSSIIGSVLYAIKELEKRGESYDAIALLEPTSPLRKKGDIDNAIKILLKNYNKTDAVVSVGEVHIESPYIMKKIEKGFIKPLMEEKNIIRQLLPKVYFPYGVIYLCKTSVLKKQKTFYPKRITPYLIERWQNYEVDDIFDLVCVEAVMKGIKK